MSIFSLDWFKSTKRKKLEALEIEEQALKVELLKKELKLIDRPYISFKLVNSILIVVLRNGDILTKSESSIDDVEKIKLSTDESDIKRIMTNSNIPVYKEDLSVDEKLERIMQKVIDHGEILLNTGDFKLIDNSYYFNEITRSIPPLLIDKLIDVVKLLPLEEKLNENAEYLSLKRFFMWACLNRFPEVAEDLYGFLMKNSFRLTEHGMFVALRNVVSVHDYNTDLNDKHLVDVISNYYTKIKAVWKKKPVNFNLYERLDEYKMKNGEVLPKGTNPEWNNVGNLQRLYDGIVDLPGNRYTDEYTKTFDIRIGQIVSMPPEECSWTRADCGQSGLHFTSDEINYVGCGDTSVLMLINPMKVVGIGDSKGRCYEYLPIMTVAKDESTKILHDLDFDTLKLDDTYVMNQLAELDRLSTEIQEDVNKHTYKVGKISVEELKKVVLNLDQIKDELRTRIQKIV